MHPEERTRLSRQCEDLLRLLECGPATNRQLAERSLKYTSRISELREAGYVIEPVSHDHATGLVTYELRGRIHDGQLPLLRTA